MLIFLFIIIIILMISITVIGYHGGNEYDKFFNLIQFGTTIIINNRLKIPILKSRTVIKSNQRYKPKINSSYDGKFNKTNINYPIYIGMEPPFGTSYSYSYMHGKLYTPVPPTYAIEPYIKVDTNDMNPEVIIDMHQGFYVVRDDKLCGGTKQRPMEAYIKEKKPKIMVYAGPSQGAAQLALGCIGQKHGIPVHIYYSGKPTELTKKAQQKGVNLTQCDNLEEAQQKALKFAAENNTQPFAFGFNDPDYKKYLIGALISATSNIKEHPKRLWIAGGSATLLNALYSVFPNTYFICIQVGKKIWWDQIDSSRTCVLIHPLQFNVETKILPPYDSVPNYDAKVWEYVKKWGTVGDFIWNVYGLHN